MDKDSIVRWIVPLEGNEKAQDINSALYRNRRVAMENARETRLQTMTEPIDLLQGEKGFLIYSPIYIRDEFGGFIVAVFRAKEWLEYVFNVNRQIMTDDFGISVYLDELPVYKNKNYGIFKLQNQCRKSQFAIHKSRINNISFSFLTISLISP